MSAIKLERTAGPTGPIYVATYPEDYTAADMVEHFKEIRKVIAEGRPYCMLIDMRAGTNVDPDARRVGIAFMEETRDQSARLCAGSVSVVSSTIIKLAMQGIFALQKPPYPYEITNSYDDALKWARLQLDRASARARVGPRAAP